MSAKDDIIRELLQAIDGDSEYSRLFDMGEFDVLWRKLKAGGWYYPKSFFNDAIYNYVGIARDTDRVKLSRDMNYTIVGTDPQKRYRYAGINNQLKPCTLTMGERRNFNSRVYFETENQARNFFEKFTASPKIANRSTPVNWKVIRISKRNAVGDNGNYQMTLIHSECGDCYQIDD